MSQNENDRNDELVSPDTRNANNEDRVIKQWNYSGKALRARCLLYWIITFALFGVGYYLAFMAMPQYFKEVWIAVAVVVGLLWINFFAIYFYRTWTIVYKLTGRCLYTYHGLIWRTSDTMELIHITDLQMKQTIWDWFLGGGGKITVMCPSDKTVGKEGELVLEGIVDPNAVLDQINEIRTELRRKRAILAGG